MNKIQKEQLIFLSFFTLLGLLALQIPFSRLLGSSVKFTLFDFFAPTAGAFLGTIPGVLSVFLMQILNIILHGAKIPDAGAIIRLFPTLFAVMYFAKKRAMNIIVPALAFAAFNLHPVGRSAWQYSLLWLIPIAAHFGRKNVLIRSLGATFTAHAVGGALWVWTFGLSRTIWLALIPQVIIERTLMATGITLSYFILEKSLNYIADKKILPFLHISKLHG